MKKKFLSTAIAASLAAAMLVMPFSVFSANAVEAIEATSESSDAEIVKTVTCYGTNAYYTIDSNGKMTVYGEGDILLIPSNVDLNNTYRTEWSDLFNYIHENVAELVFSNSGITSFNDSDVWGGEASHDADSMFWSLKSVTLPSTLTVISDSQFMWSHYLESIRIPANVTRIEDYAFAGDTKLKNLTFAEGSHLEYIGEQAFWNCPLEGEVKLPSSLKGFGFDAFWQPNCDAKNVCVFYLSRQTPIYDYVFTPQRNILRFYEDDENASYYYSRGTILVPYTEPATTTTTETIVTVPVEEYIFQTGDVNLDNSVNLIDAVYLNKYVANVVNLTNTQLQDADCNGDGNVTDQDTAILMKYLVCSISELPYTE